MKTIDVAQYTQEHQQEIEALITEVRSVLVREATYEHMRRAGMTGKVMIEMGPIEKNWLDLAILRACGDSYERGVTEGLDEFHKQMFEKYGLKRKEDA